VLRGAIGFMQLLLVVFRQHWRLDREGQLVNLAGKGRTALRSRDRRWRAGIEADVEDLMRCAIDCNLSATDRAALADRVMSSLVRCLQLPRASWSFYRASRKDVRTCGASEPNAERPVAELDFA
jgi:hypothetical protein